MNRKPTQNELESHELANIILDYDERFGHILGYRRMTEWINVLNHKQYNYKRVHRIMNLLGIHAVIRAKRSNYKKSTPQVTAQNLLARDFSASKPNEKWVTDVSEFKIKGMKKKLYLSIIMDLYDCSIVAVHISDRNNNKLVFNTYKKAIKANPGAKPMLHSDRGFQYTSKVFKAKLDKQGIVQSMSRVGCCIDNGPMEGLWGIIKSEMYYLNEFHTFQELKKAIMKYISFYNNERFQSRFNIQTPIQVREAAMRTTEPIQYVIPKNRKIEEYKRHLQQKQQASIYA
ncbi:transposase InsO family protein [Breznakia pachnodae]|uniref:Transposase InsO family protein n=1 Tax=Breznakia pachnodae TaxID=265178 RepID=A0ABU0E660_9FIRM|nr:transposase InsO family protein [Breznakia pachnodae]